MNTKLFERADDVFDLCNLLCETANYTGALSIGAVEKERMTLMQEVISPKLRTKPTKYGPIAAVKANSLFVSGESFTPPEALKQFTDLPQYQGGVRQTDDNGDFIAAFSGLPEEHDRLLALLMLYAINEPVALHHFGIREATPARYDELLETFRKDGLNPIRFNASDHMRHYAAVHGPDGGLRYMLEAQYFPNGTMDERDEIRHWDVTTENPRKLLAFLAWKTNTQTKLWEPEYDGGPIGVVWVESLKKRKKLGIMARNWNGRLWIPPETNF